LVQAADDRLVWVMLHEAGKRTIVPPGHDPRRTTSGGIAMTRRHRVDSTGE